MTWHGIEQTFLLVSPRPSVFPGINRNLPASAPLPAVAFKARNYFSSPSRSRTAAAAVSSHPKRARTSPSAGEHTVPRAQSTPLDWHGPGDPSGARRNLNSASSSMYSARQPSVGGQDHRGGRAGIQWGSGGDAGPRQNGADGGLSLREADRAKSPVSLTRIDRCKAQGMLRGKQGKHAPRGFRRNASTHSMFARGGSLGNAPEQS